MNISNTVAQLIEQMLAEEGGSLEIQRNELAGKIGCAPSQINYVITSRFTPEKGYVIESRRGGGGYIRIIKKQMHKNEYLMHFLYAIGDTIDEGTAFAFANNLMENGIIREGEKNLICAAVSANALASVPQNAKKQIRADIMRQIIVYLMK